MPSLRETELREISRVLELEETKHNHADAPLLDEERNLGGAKLCHPQPDSPIQARWLAGPGSNNKG